MLKEISEEIKKCKKCRLWKTRKNTVPGEGPEHSKIMLVGEAPGRDEDIKGRPFVGAAGNVLNKLLKSCDIKRKSIFITSVLKCRPPNNRKPTADEINECSKYLEKQIKAIKPKIICSLGNISTSYFLNKFGLEKSSIGKIHGKFFKTKDFILVPLYHPAVALYNKNMTEVLTKDFEIVKKYKGF